VPSAGNKKKLVQGPNPRPSACKAKAKKKREGPVEAKKKPKDAGRGLRSREEPARPRKQPKEAGSATSKNTANCTKVLYHTLKNSDKRPSSLEVVRSLVPQLCPT
jgi:hypothetical protein